MVRSALYTFFDLHKQTQTTALLLRAISTGYHVSNISLKTQPDVKKQSVLKSIIAGV